MSDQRDAARTQHDALDRHVREELADLDRAQAPRPAPMWLGEAPADQPPQPQPDEHLLTLFDAMAASRLVDIEVRRMRERGHGYYSIGSAGHESNALVADALRPSDPALLHYRSGGFFLARGLQAGRTLEDLVRAMLLGVVAATEDPASGGRHKVFGDPTLEIIPQTSTIASHLPRALGAAFAVGRARRLRVRTHWPHDAVVVCSFGDASLNHSTAAGTLNTAGYCVAQGLPLPLVLVCEDNGLGISVPSPEGWISAAAQRPGIRYLAVRGDDPDSVVLAAREAVDTARRQNKPALLHLRTVRYLGHAGTDVETGYRSTAQLAADLERDPLLALAGQIRGARLAPRYAQIGELVATLAEQVPRAPALGSATAIMAPLRCATGDGAAVPRHQQPSGTPPPASAGPMTLAQCINTALTDAMAEREHMLVFGEDVARKGGVYGLTRGLRQRFGAPRVFDTLLDEQAILGLGLGLGLAGLLPVPEIQYLAYLHNAEDQLRGEAASLRFFSDGRYSNPMVVRVAGLAYQRGFGGHFHNDNALAVLRDIPGLVVAVPARPEDAAPMLRACLRAAEAGGQVSVYLEPIALYHERDLHEPGDHGWLGEYSPNAAAPIGSARTHGDGTDLTIVTFGNGVRMSLRVARRLAADGIAARVLDLRWISPLPEQDLLREARATGRVLIADETRRSGGVGEGVVSALVDAGFGGRIARVCSRDSYVPLGDAANLVLLGETDIENAARDLLR